MGVDDEIQTEVLRFVNAYKCWASGTTEKNLDTFEREFASRLSDDFSCVMPGGDVNNKDKFLRITTLGYGRAKELEIFIDEFQVLNKLTDTLTLVSYREIQKEPGRNVVRRTTAILESTTTDDGSTFIVWKHLHWTWIEPPSEDKKPKRGELASG